MAVKIVKVDVQNLKAVDAADNKPTNVNDVTPGVTYRAMICCENCGYGLADPMLYAICNVTERYDTAQCPNCKTAALKLRQQ